MLRVGQHNICYQIVADVFYSRPAAPHMSKVFQHRLKNVWLHTYRQCLSPPISFTDPMVPGSNLTDPIKQIPRTIINVVRKIQNAVRGIVRDKHIHTIMNTADIY